MQHKLDAVGKILSHNQFYFPTSLLDDPTHEFGFTRHLMKNHGWTMAYAQRAIAEYKKFAFLTVVANHQVVPSDAVDQVWHAHILLTRSYWDEFCPTVLEQPLHHHPARGGRAERAEFHRLYAQTIASYQNFFGSPPIDLWSPADVRFGAELKMQRVNLSNYWVIPNRLPKLKLFQFFGLLFLIIFAATGCVSSSSSFISNNSGDNKIIYSLIVGWIMPILAGLLLRYIIRSPSQQPHKPQLDRYQVAYLAGTSFWNGGFIGGNSRAVELAIVQLVHGGYLRPNLRNRTFTITKRLPAGVDSLQQFVMQQVQKTPDLASLRPAGLLETGFLGAQLRQEKLLMSPWAGLIGFSAAIWLMLTPLSLFVAALLPTDIHSKIGMDPHVIAALWETVGLITACCLVPSSRTRWGDRRLNELRKNHDAYDVMQRFALHGYKALSGGALDELKQLFEAEAEAASSGGGCGC
jgi:uncharacterized protein (TIGR04222 family)